MNLFYKVVTGKLIRIKAVKHQVIAGQIIKLKVVKYGLLHPSRKKLMCIHDIKYS